MATFNQLTVSQKEQMTEFVKLVRSNTIQFVRALNQMQSLSKAWTDHVTSLNTSLDAATVVPDDTGLAGSSAMTKEELSAYMTAVGNILTTYNTQAMRSAYVKHAGLVNTVAVV